jgi:hypothetical protein
MPGGIFRAVIVGHNGQAHRTEQAAIEVNRPIPAQSDDILMQINNTYQYRPDLLSYDLYQTPNLWWVFYQRNPNTLTKPPLDFKQGTSIFIPKLTTLKSALGF